MKICKILLILSLPILTLASCQDYIPFWGEESTGTELPPPSEFFSFNTVGEVNLNINYGKKGSRALMEISTEDPSFRGKDGEIYYKDNAEFKVFLDENGRYDGKMVLPTYVDSVYVYTMRLNLPQLIKVAVKNNSVTLFSDADGDTEIVEREFGENDNPWGYNPDIAETDRDKFKVVASDDNTDKKDGDPDELKIWTAPVKGNKREMYTIMNWAGQRFARILPTYYYKSDGRKIIVENCEGTYNNQNLIDNCDLEEDTKDGLYLGPSDIDLIQQYLWHGAKQKPASPPTNTEFITDTENVNIVIPHKYVNEEGVLTELDGAEVWMRFLAEGARYMDGLGYYYYPTNNPPTSVDQLDLYIAIPNTSSPGRYTPELTNPLSRTKPFMTYRQKSDGVAGQTGIGGTDYTYKDSDKIPEEGATVNGYQGYNPKFVPFDTNKRVQLLYHDKKNKTVSKKFPPGITIGFFVTINEASNINSFSPNTTYEINSERIYYTNVELNSGKTPHFIALNYKNRAIYGVEDATDNSMEDVLFTIKTNPIGLVIDKDRPTLSDDGNSATYRTNRTYAFEDIWPDGGDYDMNDVVIEHYRRTTFNQDNYITELSDTFRTVHPYNAATYVDAFAIQITEDRLGDTTYKSEGIEYEKESQSYLIFTNAMQNRDKEFILTRKFDPKSGLKRDLVVLEKTENVTINGTSSKVLLNILNPYIISRYNENAPLRTEIHLPKHFPTSKANPSEIGTGADAYYINRHEGEDGTPKHPFAISLPVHMKGNSWGDHFVKPEGEGVVIEDAYPKYENWVKDGKTDQDWYLYPATATPGE